jgi:hypothetical protein
VTPQTKVVEGKATLIQWTSKAWTAFELKLPVFYRESLARILALERYRNLIETNIIHRRHHAVHGSQTGSV